MEEETVLKESLGNKRIEGRVSYERNKSRFLRSKTSRISGLQNTTIAWQNKRN